MTVLTDTQVITASGGLVELGYTAKTTDTTITSLTAGSGDVVISPVTVVCDGSPVLVEFNASCQVGAGNQINVALYRDGAEIVRFWIFEYANGAAAGQTTLRRIYRDTPTAGSHTYEVRAFRSNSNGVTTVFASATSTSYGPAIFRVSKIVQATQWPAVTTGTIICTSSTRPASPFAGQQIYETNTSRYWTYSTWSQWVPDDMVFATEAARDTAIPSANATEGMRAYITGSTVAAATGATSTSVPTGIQTIYNGSNWVCVTEVGAGAVSSSQTLTTSYADLLVSSTATSVTLSTGTTALVSIGARLGGTSNFGTLNVKTGTVSASVTGVTTPQLAGYGVASRTFVMTGLTAGTNTFTLIGLVNAAGGSFDQHTLVVRGIA